jgi:hypothetical protein
MKENEEELVFQLETLLPMRAKHGRGWSLKFPHGIST